MKPMFNSSLLIAIVLFIITSAMLWGILLLARKRQKGKTNAATQNDSQEEEERPTHNGKEKWGVGKDAYCYPSINDVMGFEFVTVQKVENELLGTQKENEKKTEDDRPTRTVSWGESQGIGGLRAVSRTQQASSTQEDDAFPEEGNPQRPAPYSARSAQQNTQRAEEPVEEVKETEEVEGISEEELDFQQSTQSMWGEWENRDEQNMMSEEEMRNLINSNEELIEEPREDDEQKRISDEIEKLRDAFKSTEKNTYQDEIGNLMDELDNIEKQNENQNEENNE